MGITTKCANGHVLRVKDEFAGKSGLCPHCRARVFVPMPIHAPEKARISDDEIMGLLGKPAIAACAALEAAPPSNSVLDATSGTSRSNGDTSISLQSSSASRKVKICAKCEHITSVAFTHCPRCGAPLPNGAKPAL
jgi:hypothetical protein